MRIKIRNLLVVAAMAVVVVGATGTAEAYTMDSAGHGWVGKGEVQTAFSWNNQAMQKNVAGVSFTYESSDTYSAVCTWTTGEGTNGEVTHDVTIPRHTRINATLGYEQRRNSSGLNGPFTGWYLTGLGAVTSSGTVPVVGEACVAGPTGNGQDGTWSSVELTATTSGGVYAVWNNTSVLLTLTLAVV
jgi:hypothetical protein